MSDLEPVKRYISHSAYRTLTECGYRYFLKYLQVDGDNKPKRVKEPQSGPMLAGVGFHAALSHAIQGVLDGKDPTVESCVAHGQKVALDLFTNEGMLASVEYSLDTSIVLDAILHRIDRAATWYLTHEFGELKPIHTELDFETPIPDTVSDKSPLGWYLIGSKDCVEADGTVRDFKLSARCPDQDKAHVSSQLSFYALHTYLEQGVVPPQLTLDYLVDSVRVHQVVRTTHRTVDQVKGWITRLQHSIRAIESGALYPANPELGNCSVTRCGLWNVCQFGGLRG